MRKLFKWVFGRDGADDSPFETGEPEQSPEDSILQAIDSASEEAAKCAVTEDWEGVYRNQTLIRKLQTKLFELHLDRAMGEAA